MMSKNAIFSVIEVKEMIAMKKRIFSSALCLLLTILSALSLCACSEPEYEYLRSFCYIYSYEHLKAYPGDESAGLYLSSYLTFEQFEELENTVFTFDGVEYVYDSSRGKPVSYDTEEYSDFYSLYDVYRNRSQGKSITVLRGTDMIAKYTSISDTESDVQLTKQEAWNVAKEWLLQFLSEKTLSHFDIPESFDEYTADSYSFSFVRCIGDYNTDESIYIEVSASGTVTDYWGYNVGKYDTLVDNIPLKNIEDAYSRLMAEIDSLNLADFEIMGEPHIRSNQSGDVYLEVLYTFTDSQGREESGGMLTNIQQFPTEAVLIGIGAGAGAVLITAGIVFLKVRHKKVRAKSTEPQPDE